MKTIAKVLSVADDYAVVETSRKSACSGCDNCQNKDVCNSELVFGNANQRFEIMAENSIGAKIGQLVEINSDSKLLLFTSFFVFVVPILFSFAFYFIIYNRLENEIISLLFTGLCFILFFVVLIIFQNRIIKKRLKVKIIRIVDDVEHNK